MIGKGTQRTIPLDLLGAIAGALDAAGNAPKTLATVRELIGQDEHPTHQGANMTTITIERETLQGVLGFLEFCWRDVAMNDYSQEQLEAATEALRDSLEATK